MHNQLKYVGIIGMNEVGQYVARCLAQAGRPVTAFHSDDNLSWAAGQGDVLVSASLTDLVERSGFLITCLASDEALQGLVDTLAKMLAHSGSGLTLIDISPVLPATMADVSARLGKCGVAALGAALLTSGDGEVTLFIEGTFESVESVRSLLTEFSATVIPTGEPGTSKVVRILESLLVGVNTVAAAEAIALAQRVGLGANTLIPLILKGSGASAVLEDGYGPAPPQGSLLQRRNIRSMRSDLDAALSLGRRHNHSLFFAALSLNAYRGASALGLDGEDCSATIRWFEHAACFDGVARTLGQC